MLQPGALVEPHTQYPTIPFQTSFSPTGTNSALPVSMVTRELILSQHQQECTHLEDISFAMEQNYSEQENDVKQDFHSVRDEIRNKNIEEKHALRIQLEGTVEELWRHFQQALRSYNEATEERKSAFEALRGRDEKSAKEIEMQMKKIQKLQDSIALVRSRLASNARESEKQNRRLQEEKEAIQGHFHTIKTQMNRARACERGQLAKLTLHSNAAIKKLQQLIEKVGQESNRIPEQRFKSMCLSSLSFQYTSP
ncbi:Coiled-coil domain-containing protein 65 [Acipenser ruthenus]|uniref:Coiled-coil domain-containing protein 65 n=1 Tax=Acipenser ruthenus TaxID=7906 RepID=A0A444UVS9_ACIRT|nr:Coiled-coil domain-containing protein 65 [Acipenser ruthenus]